MQITLPLLTFAFTTSSLALVLPRSQYGSWAVSVSKSAYANGYQSQIVSANFTSDAYPTGIVSTCKYVYNPMAEPHESSGCDNEAFSYEYDSQTIKLQQVLEQPSKQTVFGDAPLTLKSDTVGRTFSGETTVDVTSAIA